MTLGAKQRLFMRLLPQLLLKIQELGLEATMGDGFRDARVYGEFGDAGPVVDGKRLAYGSPFSAHKLRLAVDINLFKGSKYLNKTEDHAELGSFWESLHPMCEWGGHFKVADGNHYQIRGDVQR